MWLLVKQLDGYPMNTLWKHLRVVELVFIVTASSSARDHWLPIRGKT